MNIPVLPPKVAETIESYWSRWSAEAHLKHIKLTDWYGISERDFKAHDILIAYAKEHPIEYMSALVNGYEVEQTPKDELREYYNSLRVARDRTEGITCDRYDERMQTIIHVVNLLNIKISGVNAE